MAFFKHYSLKSSSICFIAFLSLLHIQHSNAVKGGYWSPDNGVPASDIDSTLFTHLFCAFASLNTQTNQLSIPSGCTTFPQTVKGKNPSVKSLLSIGGGDVSSADFNRMASQPSSRKTFIDSSINIALANGYQGLDLDWEQQATVQEMNNLAALLNEWRAAINARAAPRLLLTAALYYRAQANPAATFPTQAIRNSLDWVNVMAYDFYAPAWAPQPFVTRPHASLRDPNSQVSGSSGISSWINAGVPANKLVLGVPFYGYAWKLTNANNNGILAPSSGGDTSVANGTPRYKDIKAFISQKRATVKYDSAYVTNYCYSGTTWIGYDDTQSIATKVAYAKSTGLLGYFAWNIAQDNNWALSRQASQTWGASIANQELSRKAQS
ncbi:hypothetical protein BVRB_8g197740 [Beta vulgaris subsp. vulgaris]|uniref:class V chitinase n=1 Tax=Beta vulgaris subsp. vulgaris TaxID=3555 RepID=UPI00053F917B|nr:class V chitinase [Beta vulgaris subsp. vulgaris]KMT03226.1 hypothetical protein BVRB_8g197740 [Beta vulgaris subsp. vulgaris]